MHPLLGLQEGDHEAMQLGLQFHAGGRMGSGEDGQAGIHQLQRGGLPGVCAGRLGIRTAGEGEAWLTGRQ